MLACTCCPNPRVTYNLANAIEFPDNFTLYPAEEGSLDILQDDLEKYGLVYLNGFWHTPNLERIKGVYVISEGKFR